MKSVLTGWTGSEAWGFFLPDFVPPGFIRLYSHILKKTEFHHIFSDTLTASFYVIHLWFLVIGHFFKLFHCKTSRSTPSLVIAMVTESKNVQEKGKTTGLSSCACVISLLHWWRMRMRPASVAIACNAAILLLSKPRSRNLPWPYVLLPVCSTTVQTLHHGQLLWYPGPMLETLDMGHVSAQAPVHGGAVWADEDASVDTGPAGVTGSTVSADWERMARLGLVEHVTELIILWSISSESQYFELQVVEHLKAEHKMYYRIVWT